MNSLKTHLILKTLLFIRLISSTFSQTLEGSGDPPTQSMLPSSFSIAPTSSMTYSTSTFLPTTTTTSLTATAMMTSTTTSTATMTSTTSTASTAQSTREMSVSITLASPSLNNRQQFENDSLAGLIAYYRRQMGANLRSLNSPSFRYFISTASDGTASSFVEMLYNVTISNTEGGLGDFAEAHGELVSNGTFSALGASQSVLQTTLLGNTYFRNNRSSLADISCDIFEREINGCPEGTECVVDIAQDITTCLALPAAVSDDWPWKVGLGVGIPVFVLLFTAACCCCCYCWLVMRRKPVGDDTTSLRSVYLFTAIPFFRSNFKPIQTVYGAYHIESESETHSRTWSSRESEAEDEQSDADDYSTHPVPMVRRN